jgi:hypothetical protein
MKRIWLILFLTTIASAHTTITVNPGGGADYTSLAAAEAALPDPLTDDYIVSCSGAVDDTAPVTINVATLNGEIQYTLLIQGDNATGIFGAGYYTLGPCPNNNTISIISDSVTLSGVQVFGASNGYSAVFVRTTAADCLVEKCIISGALAVNYAGIWYENGASDTGRLAYNNVIYNCSRGVYCYRSEQTIAHNTIAACTQYGILVSTNATSHTHLLNNLITGSTTADYYLVDGYSGTLTTDYTWTGDATSPDAHASNTFELIGAPNYHLALTENGKYNCADPSVSGLTTDVDGDTRVDWDAGFDELTNLTELLCYVNPDAVGEPEDGTTWAKAYPTLQACLVAEAAAHSDLVTSQNTLHIKLHSDGTADTTAATITGFTLDTTHYIFVDSDSTYNLNVSNGTALTISEDYVRVTGLHNQVTIEDVFGGIGISIANVGATTDIRIGYCKIKGVCSGSGTGRGIYINDTTATTTVYNTIVYGFTSGADTGFSGVNVAAAANTTILSCTVYGNYYGVTNAGAGPVVVTNCAVGGSTDDFVPGTDSTIDHCCSTDGDGTNHTHPSGADWTLELTNVATGTFTLLNPASPGLVGKGIDDPGSGLYLDDFAETVRSTFWDIGAYEYYGPGPGGTTIQFWWTQRRH